MGLYGNRETVSLVGVVFWFPMKRTFDVLIDPKYIIEVT